MIVTTSLRHTETMTKKAKLVASELKLPFFVRNDQPIPELHQQFQTDVLVVSSNRLSIYQSGTNEPLFFHPNSAMFRVKRFIRGEQDPYLVATKLEKNMTILDCTLGLASDSILSSVVVGKNGKVVGVEANPYLAYVVKDGLSCWSSNLLEMNEAMRRIDVICQTNLDFLKGTSSNSFDVVYFDPMFEMKIEESNGINSIRKLASYLPLNDETIEEAKRVAKKRIVLKDHWKSTRFDYFNFHVFKRVTSPFHYGVIEL